MTELLDFADKSGLSTANTSVALTIVEWLDSVRVRGDTVPNESMRAITLFNDVLELHWNLEHPSIKVGKKDGRERVPNRAPTVPFEFVVKLGKIASSKDHNYGLRLFCSLFLLLIHSSLRFADVIEVLTIERTKTVIRGRSVDQ